LPEPQELKGKLTIGAERVELRRPGGVTRCDELTTSAANVAANEGNATQHEMAVMDRVAIVPVVRELFRKSEQLGSLRLGPTVASASEVTSCGVLEADETEIRAPEDRTDGIGDADGNSDEKAGYPHAT